MPAGSPGPESTPGRRTRVTIGYMPEVVTQLPFVWQRLAEDIERGTRERKVGIVYVPGIGIRMKSHQHDVGALFESSNAQDKWLRTGAVQVADDFVEVPVHRQYDYPGLNYLDPDATTTVPMYEKQVMAGADWTSMLTADAAAFPGPVPEEDPIEMHRVFRSTNVHYPDHALYVPAYVPFSPARGGPFLNIYFSGPAGFNKAGKGTGQYSLKWYMEGKARLYERCKTGTLEVPTRTWVRRLEFNLGDDPGPDRLYFVRIESNASESCTSQWRGNTITFSTNEQYPPHAISEKRHGMLAPHIALTGVAINFAGAKSTVYKVPLDEVHPPELEPVRVDMRQDIRGLFSVSNASFDDSEGGIEFDDDPFSTCWFPTSGIPMQVEWYGDFPPGTGCEMRIFNAATDTELAHRPGDDTEGLYINDCIGGARTYPMETWSPTNRTFYVRIKLTSDGEATPTLTHYRVIRRGIIAPQGLEVLTFPTARAAGTASLARQEIVDHIDLDDGTDDPIQEAATIVIADFTAEKPEIGLRVRQAVDVDVIDTATPPNIVSKLARFYINPNRSTQIRGKRFSAYDPTMHGGDGGYPAQEAQYPKDGSRLYTLTGNGEATRLKSMLFPHRWSLVELTTPPDEEGEGGSTATSNGAMKVTDGLATAFSFAGYSPERIDVPDLPIRFFPGSDSDASDLIIEPFSSIYDWIVENARDYLGGWPVFDRNAGASGPMLEAGMWRILKQKKPPYNILMRFTGEHPGALKVPHLLASYPYDTFVGEPFDGQITPHNFIDGDEESHWEPPEGNCVLVMGGVPTGGAQSASQLEQFIFNPVSCNFFNLAPENPHYPDEGSPDFMGGDIVPIVVMDLTLATKEAVNWIGRRVFDYACFAREYRVFHAPLRYIVDIKDPFQRYPRRLRFGDVVEVQQPGLDEEGAPIWKKYLVVRCSPSYSRDGYQFAKYELVSSSALERFGMPVGMFDFFTLEELRRKALYRRQGRSYRSNHLRTVNRKVELGASAMMALPAGALAPIQNIDPESPNFGKFNFMPDYDPIP